MLSDSSELHTFLKESISLVKYWFKKRLIHFPGFNTPFIPAESWGPAVTTVTAPNLSPSPAAPGVCWTAVSGYSSCLMGGHWDSPPDPVLTPATPHCPSSKDHASFLNSQRDKDEHWHCRDLSGKGKTPKQQLWWVEHPSNSGFAQRWSSSSNCKQREFQKCSRARHELSMEGKGSVSSTLLTWDRAAASKEIPWELLQVPATAPLLSFYCIPWSSQTQTDPSDWLGMAPASLASSSGTVLERITSLSLLHSEKCSGYDKNSISLAELCEL